jgi:hypothetical protein
MFLQDRLPGWVFRSTAHNEEQKITISTDLPKADVEGDKSDGHTPRQPRRSF